MNAENNDLRQPLVPGQPWHVRGRRVRVDRRGEFILDDRGVPMIHVANVEGLTRADVSEIAAVLYGTEKEAKRSGVTDRKVLLRQRGSRIDVICKGKFRKLGSPAVKVSGTSNSEIVRQRKLYHEMVFMAVGNMLTEALAADGETGALHRYAAAAIERQNSRR